MKNYNIDICCLQETKIREGSDKMINRCRLITLPADIQYYGTGFIISSKWKDRVRKYWKVSERISIIQLNIKEDDYIEKKYKCKVNKENNMKIY